AVDSLLLDIERWLIENGMLILTFRDYVSAELHGTQRFIPVQSDEFTIFTCFLEYQENSVAVHDLLYQKQGDRWSFSASCYQKLRLNKDWLCDRLSEIGLQVLQNEIINGMVCIIAKKLY
ncbi:MAG TPA: class I SAM-dependent methyltransferase, partial [Candidatus Sericytochromatia bacterium]